MATTPLGNLELFRNLELGQSQIYGYAGDGHTLTLATPGVGGGGSAIVYGGTPSETALDGNLGGSLNYLNPNQVFSGSVSAGSVERYSFAVRPSEIQYADGAMYLGVTVEAAPGSSLVPALPVIAGLTPLPGTVVVSGSRAFGLYRIDSAGLKLLEICWCEWQQRRFPACRSSWPATWIAMASSMARIRPCWLRPMVRAAGQAGIRRPCQFRWRP